MSKRAETSAARKMVKKTSRKSSNDHDARARDRLMQPEKAGEQPIVSRKATEAWLTFEALLMDLSVRFIHLPADQPESLLLTHIYHPTDFPQVPERMFAREHFPWALDQLINGCRKTQNWQVK